MAVTVARVHLSMANATLPGLLPTPPKTAILPAACIPIFFLPAKSHSKAKPGRTDAAERWDAHKTSRPGSSSSSTSSSSGSSPRSTGSTSSSPGHASSCDRWDSNKKCPISGATGAPSSSGKKKPDIISKRRPASRSSSAERWDLHKKPRAYGDAGVGSGEDKETVTDKLSPPAIYAGPGFVNSLERCMLPFPAFMCALGRSR